MNQWAGAGGWELVGRGGWWYWTKQWALAGGGAETGDSIQSLIFEEKSVD